MPDRTERIFQPGELPAPGVVPKRMHAWTLRTERLGEPIRAFRDEIVPVPEVRAGELLIANLYAGVNYNAVWAALGKPKNVIDGNGNFSDKKEPFQIVGSECTGIVYETGEGVTGWNVGDRVIVGGAQYDPDCRTIRDGGDPVNSPSFRVWGYEANWGAFAQFSRVRAYQCRKLPEGYTACEAAAFTAAGVAVYRMLTHWEGNRLQPGDVVLVYGGAGSVGSMAIQQAKAMGAVPIAVVSSEERGRFCREIGAAGYINRKNYHHWGRLDQYLDPDVQREWILEAMRFKHQIWKIAGKKVSPAIVVEHPGGDTLPTSLFVCANNGMVVLCGATSSYLANLDLRFLWLYQKRIQGSHSGVPEDYEAFLAFSRAHHIHPRIGGVFSWEQMPEAHQLLYEGHAPAGSLVVKIGK